MKTLENTAMYYGDIVNIAGKGESSEYNRIVLDKYSPASSDIVNICDPKNMKSYKSMKSSLYEPY